MTKPHAIRDWWARNPMTYAQVHGGNSFDDRDYTLGSREFFERLDQEFYSWNAPLHGKRPFDRLFPYDEFGSGARILEVGCGLGTMAMNWAQNGARVTGIDLNPTSVEMTRRRFQLFGLQGDIREADATALPLPSASFDYVYSWGVLHHAPCLATSLSEMMRILRPGGQFGVMLYNRNSLMHWYMTLYVEGFLHLESRFLDPLEMASRYGDARSAEGNPYTWPVTKNEIRDLLSRYGDGLRIRVLGTDLDMIFKLLLPGLGLVLPRWAKKPWARRWGWSLWAQGRKD